VNAAGAAAVDRRMNVGQRIEGAARGDLVGFSVAAADVVADKSRDAILGAPGATPNGAFSGAAFTLDLGGI
jgi:hypothetical protein